MLLGVRICMKKKKKKKKVAVGMNNTQNEKSQSHAVRKTSRYVSLYEKNARKHVCANV